MPDPTRPHATTTVGLLVGLLLALTPTLAAAASPPITGQAITADAVFLDYAPPPAGGAGALCLVDTGVNANPDTTPGLISATALDGGTGSDVDPLGHGTVDAAIAGGSGQGGLLGAWPGLKLISVRSTNVPSPGQEPIFEFDDYARGISLCSRPVAGRAPVYAIDLPLSSIIPPSPDQTAAFTNATTVAHTQGISVVAAAGNKPGAIALPASEPGVFAVGGDQVTAAVNDPNAAGVCSDSATTGLTFFAPGCGLDTINPQTDVAKCCGNGTSQASAYTAAILVALRSYDPALTPDKAAQLLLSTTANGHLDVAAAFRADGLGAIVDAGNAATPKPPPPPAPAPAPAPIPAPPTPVPGAPSLAPRVPLPLVKTATWRHGILRIALTSLPAGARLHAKLTFTRRAALYIVTRKRSLHRRIPHPATAVLHLSEGSLTGATVTVKL